MKSGESGTDAPEPPAKRRRDAGATREAILRSAVAAFTRHGYDGVGVREIARDAGVTAMLINRYFGSKEQLFAEAVDTAFAPRTVVSGEAGTLGRDTALTLVARTASGADRLDPFLLMLRSAGSPRAAEIVRTGVERHVGRDLAARLPGPGADERAELLLSVLAGVWLMRKVLGTQALAGADPAELAGRIEALFEPLVSPPEAASTQD
ncbi:TetR family transcriptional regulator [Streptomyces sulfonofaciens]|uniref:TetR family transcriptional regulator n=1 Tax=Streptomyces sulfonofaciens TaxID=68272 RepID=A0A919KRH2_9ACTN|nr:TetR/AcrR family transcriptional regulator [Streptomyces sulfonofaciens]GHH69703.1 TetR family transcriptional regulator [Streptomyces sulfonofaciens]